jgi:integral membrane protein
VLKDPLARLRLIGTMEGVSFLVLLGIAMPLKYLAGKPEMVRIVGSAHGLLFVLFAAAVIDTAVRMRWPLTRVMGAMVASVLPFGPFVFDAHLRRTAAAQP